MKGNTGVCVRDMRDGLTVVVAKFNFLVLRISLATSGEAG